MVSSTEKEGIEISFNVTIEELNEIEDWLRKEHLRSGKGFYCNWHTIENAYSNNRVAIVKQNGATVGFAAWYPYEHTADINIAEIKPGLRKKGLGKLLLKKLEEYLLERHQVYVVKVHCQPSESEKAWKRMGFIQYPDVVPMSGFNMREGKHLYKILIPTMPVLSISEIPNGELIKLWAEERYSIKDTPPNWVWHLEFKPKSRRLINPIIHPAYSCWRMAWDVNGMNRIDDEVKYFPNDASYGDFMIVTELPQL